MLGQILSAISSLSKLVDWLSDFFFKQKLEVSEKNTEAAQKKYTEANIIADDQLRLAEKEKARRELEDSFRSRR